MTRQAVAKFVKRGAAVPFAQLIMYIFFSGCARRLMAMAVFTWFWKPLWNWCSWASPCMPFGFKAHLELSYRHVSASIVCLDSFREPGSGNDQPSPVSLDREPHSGAAMASRLATWWSGPGRWQFIGNAFSANESDEGGTAGISVAVEGLSENRVVPFTPGNPKSPCFPSTLVWGIQHQTPSVSAWSCGVFFS